MEPEILAFATGSSEFDGDGGSGFENLVRKTMGKDRALDAKIVGVVSNHERGSVFRRAKELGVPFIHFPNPWTAERYLQIARASKAEFFVLSGWLKRVLGLDPRFTFNIHPGPLPEFGGKGMYRHHVHAAVFAAFKRGEISHSAVCMHFVIPEYDRGPVFFRFNIKIQKDDTVESLSRRVNNLEKYWQPIITNLVVHRKITWDGISFRSLRYPRGYEIVRYGE